MTCTIFLILLNFLLQLGSRYFGWLVFVWTQSFKLLRDLGSSQIIDASDAYILAFNM